MDALPLPATIRELVLDRLDAARTPRPAPSLDLAAVGGDGTDLDTLVAASELPRGAVADAAGLLVRRACCARTTTGSGSSTTRSAGWCWMRSGRSGGRAAPPGRRCARASTDPTRSNGSPTTSQAGETRRAVAYLREAGRDAAAVHAYAAAADYLARAVDQQRRVRPASPPGSSCWPSTTPCSTCSATASGNGAPSTSSPPWPRGRRTARPRCSDAGRCWPGTSAT